jgi:hypothetical protein
MILRVAKKWKREKIAMLYPLARYWWTIAVRGVIAVLFGILTFLFLGISLLSLVLLFGAYVLLDGVLAVAAAIESPSHQWALIVEGIFGIAAGMLTVVWPGSGRLLDRSLRRRVRNRDDCSSISSSPFRQICSGRVNSDPLAEAIRVQIGCDA